MLFEEARSRLMKYCAYQERCHKEVEAKLRSIGADRETADQVILYLLEHNFLNEERFARAFAGGKFRTKKWGRTRLERELRQRDISDYCIRKAMEEITGTAYNETLNSVIQSKARTVRARNPYELRYKIAQYAIQKGYEPQLVWEIIREEFPDNQ